MARHIHIHIGLARDAVFGRTSPQAFGALATAARAEKRGEELRAQGNTFKVRRRQKNGGLGPPDQFSVNLSVEQARKRKAELESMNPGNTYEIES